MTTRRCPACGRDLPEAFSFCPECGEPLATLTRLETLTSPRGSPSPSSPGSGGAGAPSAGSRFLPGAILGGRYRIVSPLGRGGMGEVYRADDLKLGLPVALKFLPREVQRDRERLSQLLAEARVALRVSHPNVCRVHDIRESDGQHYISMEYVDGEDLASLLRRIGRLPADKAVEIAQQLCAGLAAAHARRVLHRDLKPANVMIDGRGRAKITDFGLARLSGELRSSELAAGTPAYMAPEQLAGRAVSVQSDLYSLGLVLYELFTGRRAFEAETLDELRRQQQDSPPRDPSSVVVGIDPAIELVILRCLAREPGQRPASAQAVAAALPGGDPLAAALAAGETPSPDLVAAAGGTGVLPRWAAWALLGAFLGALAFVVGSSRSTRLARVIPLPKSPEVLVERARAIAAGLGREEAPGDRSHDFAFNSGYLNQIAPGEWIEELAHGRPPALLFLYHESPEALRPAAALSGPLRLRLLYRFRPPAAAVAGAWTVELDPEGRLRRFEAAPAPREAQGNAEQEPDWPSLFAQADLKIEEFTLMTPSGRPSGGADRRLAWSGVYPQRPEVPIRVEAEAAGGRAVRFRILEPWELPDRAAPASDTRLRAFRPVVSVALIPLTLLVAAYFAHRNLRRGRGDRRGALRLALSFFTLSILSWLLGAHHVADSSEQSLFIAGLAISALHLVMIWLYYMALEPHARRFWPEMMTSWARLLEGRFRDPLVGRHLLIGCLLGVGIAVLITLRQLLPQAPGSWLLPWGDLDQLDSLHSGRLAVAQLIYRILNSAMGAFGLLTLLVVLRALLRRNRLAIGAFLLLLVLLYASGDPRWDWLSPGLSAIAALFVLFRFGVLPVIVGVTVMSQLGVAPLTWDLSAWYADRSLLTIGSITAVALHGFFSSLGGRSLLRDELARV